MRRLKIRKHSTDKLNENGDTERVITATAKNGVEANNMLTDAQLDTVANVVAETIGASYERSFDRELALGIFEKETFIHQEVIREEENLQLMIKLA